MKTMRIATIALMALLIAGNGFAFDGERKGFVLGFGTGFAPLIKGKVSYPGADFDNERGSASHLHIGHAWNNRNMILFSAYQTVYEAAVMIRLDDTHSYRNEIQVIQGFMGITYRHYFSPVPKSFFVTAGIGGEQWIPNEFFISQSGWGLLFGGGYAFGKWVEVEASFGLGTSGYVSEHDNSQLMLTLNGSFY